MDKIGLGGYLTINHRQFLLIYNPFWQSSDFLDTFGPSRSVCSVSLAHLCICETGVRLFYQTRFFARAEISSLQFFSTYFNSISRLNTQFCIKGLLVVLDFCFWAVWAARPVLKKRVWADYEELLEVVFSCF